MQIYPGGFRQKPKQLHLQHITTEIKGLCCAEAVVQIIIYVLPIGKIKFAEKAAMTEDVILIGYGLQQSKAVPADITDIILKVTAGLQAIGNKHRFMASGA